MNFVQAIKACFARYADFSGRSSRSEYWYFFLFVMLAVAVGDIVHFALPPAAVADGATPAWWILGPILFLPALTVAVRRLHDSGMSGWWLLINIPLILLIAFLTLPAYPVLVILNLIWFCRRGDAGENRYGPDPLSATA